MSIEGDTEGGSTLLTTASVECPDFRALRPPRSKLSSAADIGTAAILDRWREGLDASSPALPPGESRQAGTVSLRGSSSLGISAQQQVKCLHWEPSEVREAGSEGMDDTQIQPTSRSHRVSLRPVLSLKKALQSQGL